MHTLRIFLTSHGYSHCNFTARVRLSPSLAERFMKAIQDMDYDDPGWKQVMNLEGLTRWMPGSTAGYDELEREARRLEMLSEEPRRPARLNFGGLGHGSLETRLDVLPVGADGDASATRDTRLCGDFQS